MSGFSGDTVFRKHNTVFSVEGHRRIAKVLPDPDPEHEQKYVRTDFYYTTAWQTIEERTDDNLDSEDSEKKDTKCLFSAPNPVWIKGLASAKKTLSVFFLTY